MLICNHAVTPHVITFNGFFPHIMKISCIIFSNTAEQNGPFTPGALLYWFSRSHLAVRGWLSKRNSCICLITEQELWMDIIPLACCYLQQGIREAQESYLTGRQIKPLPNTTDPLTRFKDTQLQIKKNLYFQLTHVRSAHEYNREDDSSQYFSCSFINKAKHYTKSCTFPRVIH